MDPDSPASSNGSDSEHWDEDQMPSKKNSNTNFSNKSSLKSSLPRVRTSKKSKLQSKKSQLTPRVALYIPPHLQKYQSDISVKKVISGVEPNTAVKPPKINKVSNSSNLKIKETIKIYHKKQFLALYNQNEASENSHSIENKVKRVNKKKLPSNLLSIEIQNLLSLKKKYFDSFLSTGSEEELKKSKQTKSKLRYLIRQARATLRPKNPNPYHFIKSKHAEWYGDNTPEISMEDDDQSIVIEENMSEVSSNDDMQDIQDSSYYFAMKHRMNSRLEWSESILKFNSDPSYLKSQSILKGVSVPMEEHIFSDEDNSDDDCRERRARARDYSKTQAGGSESESSSRRSTQDMVVNSSDNEYLNQQFLRQQHDFERQQKFNQLLTENGGRDLTIFSKPEEPRVNFLVDKSRYSSDEKSFDKTLKDYRLHDLNKYKNNSDHEDFDSILSELREPLAKKKPPQQPLPCPQEPFMDSVRYKKTMPSSIRKERVTHTSNDRLSLNRHESAYSRNYENYYRNVSRYPDPHSSYPDNGATHRVAPFSERTLRESSRGDRRNPDHSRYERRYPDADASNYSRKKTLDVSRDMPGWHYPSSSEERYDRRHRDVIPHSMKRSRGEDWIHENRNKRRKY